MLYCVCNSFRIKSLSPAFVRILLLHIKRPLLPSKYYNAQGLKGRKRERKTAIMWLFLPNRKIQLCWSSQINDFLLFFIKILGLKKSEWLLPPAFCSNALWNTVLPLLFYRSPHFAFGKSILGVFNAPSHQMISWVLSV